MSQQNNKGFTAGASRPAKKPPVQDYAHGNSNWNTNNYKQSVKTSRTDTRVINSDRPAKRKKSTYYYDNTPEAVKARQRKRFEEKKRQWQKSVKKNVRERKIKASSVYIISTVAALILVVGVLYALLFVTTDITVNGADHYTTDQIKGATGLTDKTHLYSFSSKQVAKNISFECPRVSDADINRTMPNKVAIDVTEEKPVYYTEIYGDTYFLSPSLRILEKTSEEDARAEGLGKLDVNKVEKAISGDKLLLCSERAQRYLENTVNLVNSSELYGRITRIDMTDEFNMYMIVDGLYKLEFGTQDEMDIKIRLAVAVLKDPMFEAGNKAYIDLTDTSKTSVIVDNQLVLD